MLFVHGDGPAERDGFGLYPQLWESFAAIGVASISWDRPGTGQSEGDWLGQTFDDRAEELAAAFDFAKDLPDVDDARIGVWGISQAGWIIPKALAKTQLSVVVCVSCPGGTVAQQAEYLLRKNLELDGRSLGEADAAIALLESQLRVQRAPGDIAAMEAYRDHHARVANDAWMQSPAAGALLPGEPRIFGPDIDYDPRGTWAESQVPILAIYGALDSQVDSDRGLRTFDAVATGGRDISVKIIPHANHAILTATTGSLAELAGQVSLDPKPYAPGYLALTQAWLGQALRTVETPMTTSSFPVPRANSPRRGRGR